MKKLLMLVVTLMLGASLAMAQAPSGGSTDKASGQTTTAKKKSTKAKAAPKAKATKKDAKAKKDTTPAK
jgi:hypothetical protein